MTFKAVSAVAFPTACVLAITGCTGSGQGGLPTPTASGSGDKRPNIVYVLTDDLSMNLLQYMPNVRKLGKDGTTFSNYTVSDSLCCSSRSTIFTGKYPHDTGVFTNSGDDGGFNTFHRRGNEDSTFATSLQKAGYRTGMMGKYLNLYKPKMTVDGQKNYVPPGWDEWAVAGNGYPEYNYNLNVNHTIEYHGKKPADYLTNVLADKATDFITDSGSQPFFLEVATFAPHGPFTPAKQDTQKFPGLNAPRDKSYGTLPKNAPPWLAQQPELTKAASEKLDTGFRKRAQAVQAVDRMVAGLRDTLEQRGIADNTLVVFNSDNGFHMGEHGLKGGKQTAFDTDVHVPLMMAGPDVPTGKTVDQIVQNTDLAPTFEQLAGQTPDSSVDGRSVMPLLADDPPDDWRSAGLIEHHGPDRDKSDPDYQSKDAGNPTSYEAMRTKTSTYVEYADGSTEYYDRRTDPYELNNTAGSLSSATKRKLHAQLKALQECKGTASCKSAGKG